MIHFICVFGSCIGCCITASKAKKARKKKTPTTPLLDARAAAAAAAAADAVEIEMAAQSGEQKRESWDGQHRRGSANGDVQNNDLEKNQAPERQVQNV